ncbi:MFS transporter [Klugiella xanthotipulae]|uniref:Putative proline/betaine transporter n=1 Tax=Klugiella xanthotipulae TaxID=244735 RepID=A0A543HYQ4_9MICO|nr:MFS transporter [Klugiella xanthotipulae]TQM63476.1 metabolite-proton symporter [Klugiella xanthotipulae]
MSAKTVSPETHSGHTAETGQKKNTRGRVILASLIGTSIEFYDFYVYATAAVLVFPALFFPAQDDPTIALLSSFAIFGVAFVARPVGALLFGHFGDKHGRKVTLVASLLTMGISTFIIGLLPTFDQIGYLAPGLLVLMRFGQGLGLGGEWSGAVLVATENAPKGRRALWGTFPQVGAPIGFILANGVFLIINWMLPHSDNPALASEAFLAWGWRIPFLISAVLVIIGLWVRLSLVESDSFTRVVESGQVRKLPLASVFRSNWRNLIIGTFIMVATYSLFYLMTTFTLTFGTTPTAPQAEALGAKGFTTADAWVGGLGFGRNDFIIMMIVGVIFFGIFTLISGPMADFLGRRTLLIWVTILIIVFGGTFSLFLGGTADETPRMVGAMAFLVIGFTLMGMTFGPMGALLPELFPANVRYTGSAFAYNMSSILGAAVAPFIAVWLWKVGNGNPWLVGIYLSSMGVLTLIALLFSRETKDDDYAGNITD